MVNNSSVHGVTTGAGVVGPYSVSKFGVTRITEALYYDLARINSKLKCTLLCPGEIATKLDLSERNRPSVLKDNHCAERQAEIEAKNRAVFLRHQSGGMAPSEVADRVFNAIKAEQFYLITEPNPDSLVRIKENVRVRMESILAERNLPLETTPR